MCPVCALRLTSMSELVTHVAHCMPPPPRGLVPAGIADNPKSASRKCSSLDVDVEELEEDDSGDGAMNHVSGDESNSEKALELTSSHHPLDRQWECRDCGKLFPQASYLAKHQVIHSEVSTLI